MPLRDPEKRRVYMAAYQKRWKAANREKSRKYCAKSRAKFLEKHGKPNGMVTCFGCKLFFRREIKVVSGRGLIRGRWLCPECCSREGKILGDPEASIEGLLETFEESV